MHIYITIYSYIYITIYIYIVPYIYMYNYIYVYIYTDYHGFSKLCLLAMSCFYLSFPGGDCSTRYQSQCFFLCHSFFLYDRYDPWGCLKNGGSLSHHRLQYSTGLMTWMMTGGTPICVFFNPKPDRPWWSPDPLHLVHITHRKTLRIASHPLQTTHQPAIDGIPILDDTSHLVSWHPHGSTRVNGRSAPNLCAADFNFSTWVESTSAVLSTAPELTRHSTTSSWLPHGKWARWGKSTRKNEGDIFSKWWESMMRNDGKSN